jgi:hypothetical protein
VETVERDPYLEDCEMKKNRCLSSIVLLLLFMIFFPSNANTWHDETHIAIAKVAGYYKWYNAAGADIAKVKAGKIEGHNHYRNNSPGLVVTPEMVFAQAERYNQIEGDGHLYGAIIASFRDYIAYKQKGKSGERHLAYCIHYIGDLSQPLHNILYNQFNKEHHKVIDGIINDEVLYNLQKIKLYPIKIESEEDLAKEIARIANISIHLGFKIEKENRLLSKGEAYSQVGHSASLVKAIVEYVRR